MNSGVLGDNPAPEPLSHRCSQKYRHRYWR